MSVDDMAKVVAAALVNYLDNEFAGEQLFRMLRIQFPEITLVWKPEAGICIVRDEDDMRIVTVKEAGELAARSWEQEIKEEQR